MILSECNVVFGLSQRKCSLIHKMHVQHNKNALTLIVFLRFANTNKSMKTPVGNADISVTDTNASFCFSPCFNPVCDHFSSTDVCFTAAVSRTQYSGLGGTRSARSSTYKDWN